MEFSGTYIQRNSSKIKLVVFCYFPVKSCKKSSGWSFHTHIYKEIVQIKTGSFLLPSSDQLQEREWMKFRDAYIQGNSLKLKLVVFCNFPVTCCKKAGGWSFWAYIYKEIVQN